MQWQATALLSLMSQAGLTLTFKGSLQQTDQTTFIAANFLLH